MKKYINVPKSTKMYQKVPKCTKKYKNVTTGKKSTKIKITISNKK